MRSADRAYPGPLDMPRSRGAISGLLLILLGAWGALIPFVGPRFNFAYTPNQEWAWSPARGWLEVLPGAVAVVGGLLLIVAGNRLTAVLGGWLAVAAGAWFVVGNQLAPLLGIGSVGDPIAATDRKRAALEIAYFTGLGALIVFFGGLVLARTAVRLARDVAPVSAPTAPAAPAAPAAPVAAQPAEPYHEAPEEPVSSGALTQPRVAQTGPEAPTPKRGWRRPPRAGAGPGQNAASLRWPHAQ
ncbi:MAG: hypothetical protein QOC58_690 [Mycobacterium sp.]|nr:hypothetical protein [Mycobacterium sp.]